MWSSLYQYNCQCYNIELGDVYKLKHALLVACETWQIIIGHQLLFETRWISHELIFQFEKYDSLGCSFSNRSNSDNFVFFIWVLWDFENLFQWNVLAIGKYLICGSLDNWFSVYHCPFYEESSLLLIFLPCMQKLTRYVKICSCNCV